MRRRMSNPRSLKVRSCDTCLIDPNAYLAVFHGEKAGNKMCVKKLNGFSLNSMPNSWSNQAHVQGFDCESINFKAYINMFECMKI